jgi:hypothetical protein
MRLFFLAATGAALLASGCSDGGTNEEAEGLVTDGFDANNALSVPANDASALEMAAEAPAPTEPAPPLENGAASSNQAGESETSAPVRGVSQGGDTGGNTVQGNSTSA